MIKHRKKIILFTIIATVLGAAGIHLIQLKFLTKKSVFNKQIIENVKPGPSPSTEEKQEFISSKLKQIPENKVLGNGKHVYQTFNNCGPAALEMALAYFNKSDSQQLIGRQLRPYQNPQGINDDKSVTLTEMAVWVEENKSLKAYHRPAGNIEMVKQFINYDIPVIIRTWLDKNEDIGHYRVVKGFNDLKNTVIQDDSLQGKDLSYKYNDFNQLWEKFNYEFLVLVPKEKQPVAEIILGDILKEEAAWRHSLQISEEILQDSPDNVDALFNRVVALYHLQRYQEAVMAFEKIESDLSKRTLWYQIEPILAYYQVGEYDQVEKLSREIFADQNKAYSELYILRANIFLVEGEREQAVNAFKKAELYNKTDYWLENLQTIEQLKEDQNEI